MALYAEVESVMEPICVAEKRTTAPRATMRRLGPMPRAALLIFLLLAMGLCVRQMLWSFSAGPANTDLRIFLSGIELVRTGHGHEIYHFDAEQAVQVRLYPETRLSGTLSYNHLAYELLIYWPLAALSYRSALITWAVLNLGIVFVIAWLLNPYTKSLREVTGLPVALFLLAFYPLMIVLVQGQDSLLFFLLVVLSLRVLDNQRSFSAGALLAAACFKFHLALMIAFFVFFLRGKWKGLAGFAAGGILVTATSGAIAGPNFVRDYLTELRMQETVTPWGFIPWFMPNLRGILQWGLARWLDLGSIRAVIFLASTVIGVVATWLIVRSRPKEESSGYVYSVAILTAILLSYHLHMQDLTLALLPMLLLTDRVIGQWAGARDEMQLPLSPLWGFVLMLSVAGFYLFRIAFEPFPLLQVRGCLLAVPVLLLWTAALKIYCDLPFCRTGADTNGSLRPLRGAQGS
jgi:hypothetical protein